MSTNDTTTPFTIGIALDGAGWHPSAWREASSRPGELFTAGYWVDLARAAEAAGADYVTIEDSLAVQGTTAHSSDDRTDEVRGRLDALLIANRIAPATDGIGIIPVVTTTHTEPFHVSKGVATLDFTSEGRAGWQPKVSIGEAEAANFGRRAWPEVALPAPGETGPLNPALERLIADLFDEADDAVEVVRRLWDSWEDDAEIRDVATDRFLDAEKLHNIDFEGRFFGVRGPSITPRSPQGQPVVAALAHNTRPYEFAARSADVVFVTPADADHAAEILREVETAAATVERSGEQLRVIADLVVIPDAAGESGADRRARLDALGRSITSDAPIVEGSASEIADIVGTLVELGYHGVRLRPAVLTDDVPWIGDELVPELRRRGLLPDATGADAQAEASTSRSLRARLGLEPHPANRYAGAAGRAPATAATPGEHSPANA